MWLPTAARLEEKARISWPGASPSRLLPAAECFGAEGGLFPTGFGPGARGCPCLELLPNVRGSRRQLGSGHFCWQNLALCSTLPINKIPAQAEPLASTEVFPSCSCIVSHNVPRGQWQQGGLVPSHRGFRKDNSPVAKLSSAPLWVNAVGFVSMGHYLPLRVLNRAAANSPGRLPRLNPHTNTWKWGCKIPSWGWAAHIHSHVSSCSNVTSPSCGGSSSCPRLGCSHPRGLLSSHVGDAAASAVPRPWAVTAPAGGFFRTRAGFLPCFRD